MWGKGMRKAKNHVFSLPFQKKALLLQGESTKDRSMTTLELRTSIASDLDQMSVEMLEVVSHYVKRLRNHARPVRRTVRRKFVADNTVEDFTPRVMRFKRGNPWYASDEEVDRLRYEYLSQKYL